MTTAIKLLHTPPRLSFEVRPETALLLTSVFWSLSANQAFFGAALHERTAGDPSAWGFGVALVVLLVALHFLLLAPLVGRWTLKPLLSVMLVSTALASHYMQQFGIYLDPSMLRNVLRSDVREAGELFSGALLKHLLMYAGLPLWVLWRLRIVHRPWAHAALVRLGTMLLAAAVTAVSLLAVFQPFASLMRNHKEIRYLITPANFLWSLGSVVAADAPATGPRQAIGLDALRGPGWAHHDKPRLLVLVVGETARRANWGLSGYARQTTPALAALPEVINFPKVTSCGTNTEVSVPCMFAPVGRRHYDESRIRHSESLLHVAARAGVAVQWRDNQAGCKGVCEGLPNESVADLSLPGLCDGGRCLDEGLLAGLDERLKNARGTQLLVLHQMGSHGPSYFRRYPATLGRFQPACEHDDLRRCSVDEIVNAYDNSMLYTDHLLARLVHQLQGAASVVDSALIYVSDHGESLGEGGLFLHGLPYAIAPAVQTEVPMVMWLSAGFSQSLAVSTTCLRRQAQQPASHDHLFHTVLGLLEVQTALYEPALDLLRPCKT